MNLSADKSAELLETLKTRFEANLERHKSLSWTEVEKRLASNKEKLWSLFEMERTGGNPDVVGFDDDTKEYIFFDCSKQSPEGRRSLCYDRECT